MSCWDVEIDFNAEAFTMSSVSRQHYAELQELFGRMFDERWSRSELGNYDELRSKFVFHMTDAIEDVAQLAEIFGHPIACDFSGAEKATYQFFLHAVPHLLAAGQIYDYVPDTFPEQQGVHWNIAEYADALLEERQTYGSERAEPTKMECIRSRKDNAWRKLSSSEQALMRGLALDLASIGGVRAAPDREPPSSELARFQIAVEQEDWMAALDVLRANEQFLAPDAVVYMRGLCWAHLREPSVALEFLYELRRLRGLNDSELLLLLSCLLHAERIDEALTIVATIEPKTASAKLSLKAAEVLSMAVGEVDCEQATQLRIRAIQLAEAGLNNVTNGAQDAEYFALRPASYLHLAINYVELGEFEKARKACQTALAIDSHDSHVRDVLNWIEQASTHPRQSSRIGDQLRHAIPVPLPTVPIGASLCGAN